MNKVKIVNKYKTEKFETMKIMEATADFCLSTVIHLKLNILLIFSSSYLYKRAPSLTRFYGYQTEKKIILGESPQKNQQLSKSHIILNSMLEENSCIIK